MSVLLALLQGKQLALVRLVLVLLWQHRSGLLERAVALAYTKSCTRAVVVLNGLEEYHTESTSEFAGDRILIKSQSRES